MILHPAIITLEFVSIIIAGMIIYSSFFGIRIIKFWNLKSGSEEQLALERRTYLISTILPLILIFQFGALFLYIYTAESLHGLFTGAMCAAGSLNVNTYGYPVFMLKIANCVLACLWLIVNYVDNQAYDYPLIKKKYTFLIFLAPFIIAESIFQFMYFSGLKADVITSCCGSLFSSDRIFAETKNSKVPIKGTIAVYYGALLLMFGSGISYLIRDKWSNKTSIGLKHRKKISAGRPENENQKRLDNYFFTMQETNIFPNNNKHGYLFSFASGIFFLISAYSLVSFISLYFYELPTHHCPFCILQKEYGYVGYFLYSALLAGVISGLGTGLLIPFRNIISLSFIISGFQRRLVMVSLISNMIFSGMTIYRIFSTDFTLRVL